MLDLGWGGGREAPCPLSHSPNPENTSGISEEALGLFKVPVWNCLYMKIQGFMKTSNMEGWWEKQIKKQYVHHGPIFVKKKCNPTYIWKNTKEKTW